MLRWEYSKHWTNAICELPHAAVFQNKTPDLFLTVMGRFFSDGEFAFEHVITDYSLQIIHSGAGIMEINGIRHHVCKGDLFLFLPGNHARYHDQPESPWRYAWLKFRGKLVSSVMKHIGLTESTPHRRGNFGVTLEALLKEIEKTYKQEVIPPSFAVSSAWRVIDAISRDIPSKENIKVGMAELAKTLIESDDMRTLSVEKIAGYLRVSRSSLFRNFRRAYKVSPKDYMESLRVDQAKQLLLRSNSSIKEIAAACGYANAQYFCKAFRQKCGVTPSYFRANK